VKASPHPTQLTHHLPIQPHTTIVQKQSQSPNNQSSGANDSFDQKCLDPWRPLHHLLVSYCCETNDPSTPLLCQRNTCSDGTERSLFGERSLDRAWCCSLYTVHTLTMTSALFPYGHGDASDSDSEYENPHMRGGPERSVGIDDGQGQPKRFDPRAPSTKRESFRRSISSWGRSSFSMSTNRLSVNRMSFMPSKVRKVLDEKDKKEKGHVVPRLLLCALAVGLLWSTSLIICKELVVNVIPRPTTDYVLAKAEVAFDLTTLNKNGYKDCAVEKQALCERRYLKSAKDETDRLEEIRKRNWERLATYRYVVLTCDW
jgi:hypothetical protein